MLINCHFYLENNVNLSASYKHHPSQISPQLSLQAHPSLYTMSTHIAIASTAKGEIDQIQVTTEAPGKGEVLIKTAYGSMIAFDTYVTDRGYYVQSYPATLGFSSAGVVEKVGEGVDDLKVGDRVSIYC